MMARRIMAARGRRSLVQPLRLTFRTTTDMEVVTIPCQNVGVFNATLDWGDGSSSEITAFDDIDLAHTYDVVGDYDVVVAGGFPNIYFNDGGDKTKLIAVSGGQQHSFAAIDSAFFGAVNLTEVSAIDSSSATNFDSAWYNCSSLTDFPLLNSSSATSFAAAWRNCSSLTSFPLLNTSSVTSFAAAWRDCSSLTSFPLLDTSSATNFGSAWRSCSSLTSFPLLNTSSATNFASAWNGCSSLADFPLLNTSSATNFANSWNGCSSLTSFPLLNTSSVTRFESSWRSCSSLTSFPSGFFDAWTATPVVNCFLNAWSGCSALTPESVINILTSLDTSGQSAPASGVDITIDYAGGDISAASTAIANLISHNWTVTINGVAQ